MAPCTSSLCPALLRCQGKGVALAGPGGLCAYRNLTAVPYARISDMPWLMALVV